MAKIQPDELQQFHDFGVYTPARIISLDTEIDEDSAAQFIKNIRLMDHLTEKEITVLINTPGGSVHQGLAIYDAIKECRSEVITHAVGPCWSMGAIILQAGDQRIISQNATVMIHEGSTGFDEDHVKNIERWYKEDQRIGKVCDQILFEKMKEKNPKFTMKKLQQMNIFDTILTAEEAVKYGLAQKIAEHKGYINE